MKTKISHIIYYSLILILLPLTSCDNKSGQIEELTMENSVLLGNYENQLAKSKELTQKTDSLHTIINHLESENQKLKGEVPTYVASSEDEKAIESLVNSLHQGWTTMAKTKNTNELLQYFLPKYTAGAVRVNTENIPSVKRSNDANFEEHLQELLAAEDIAVSFGQTKFLYTEVKGNFFATSYRTRIRVYQKNKEVHTSSLVTLLAGEKKDGWKVGSYNWVTFNY